VGPSHGLVLALADGSRTIAQLVRSVQDELAAGDAEQASTIVQSAVIDLVLEGVVDVTNPPAPGS
jgi:hypothetical protein